jgi:diguanylate cyclase (GGDEF)-like protein
LSQLRFQRLRRTVAIFIAFAVLLGIGMSAYELQAERERELHAAGQRLRTLSVALRENADNSLQGAEMALRELRRNLMARGSLSAIGAEEVHRAMTDSLAGLPRHYAFFMTDRNGHLVANNQVHPAPDVDLSDRPYFTELRRTNGDDIFIQSLTRARANGDWGFYVALPTRDRQGQFDGVLAVVLRHQFFTAFHQQLDLGPAGTVNLLRSDGALLARHPLRDGDAAVSVGDHPVFRQALRERNGYAITENSGFKHEPRIIGFDASQRYPVVVTVTITHAAALEPWRDAIKHYAIILGVSCLVFLTLGGMIYQQLNQLELATYETVHDALTGLINRRGLDRALRDELKRARREHQPLSVLMIDVDFFKAYNDRYGHQGGDDCLRAVAQTLKDALRRPADLCARYGGEEFVCLLPNTDQQGAKEMAEAMRAAVEGLRRRHSASSVASVVTISVGATTATPDAHVSARNLIRSADSALYKAKREGRNCCRFRMPSSRDTGPMSVFSRLHN